MTCLVTIRVFMDCRNLSSSSNYYSTEWLGVSCLLLTDTGTLRLPHLFQCAQQSREGYSQHPHYFSYVSPD